MHPYLKFYAAKNPAFGKEIEPVVAPTFEEWEELLGYEPTKVNRDYNAFCEQYIIRKTESRALMSSCQLLICKVVIDQPDSIAQTEQRSDFVRWVK